MPRLGPQHRRRALALVLLPVLVLVLLAGKLLSVGLLTDRGSAALAAGDAPAAARFLDPLGVLNVVEPWKAHLARGDAAAAGRDRAGAGREFARALDLAPDDGSACLVRVNLVRTIARQASVDAAAGRAPAAAAGFRRVVDLVGAGDGERCDAEDRRALATAAQEAREALALASLPVLPATTATAAPAPPPGAAPPPTQAQLDDLREEAAQAAQARSGQAAEDGRVTDPRGPTTTTPW
ncbi:hypothetical protein F1544_21605 [Kineosporiaceae bacterium B12]|nr:hypothetical protein [Kineococcus rubinsiae]